MVFTASRPLIFCKILFVCTFVFFFCFSPLVTLLKNRFSSLLRFSIGFLVRRNGIHVYVLFLLFYIFDRIICSIGMEHFLALIMSVVPRRDCQSV